MSDHPMMGQVTVSQMLGELTWLLTQSAKHQNLRVKDLAWLLAMPIALKQFHVFRDGAKPIGAAIWAKTDEAGKQALLNDEFDFEHCSESAWHAGSEVWLVELIAPFSNLQNRHAELMLADLMTGVLKGIEFHFIVQNPATGKREPVKIEAGAGEQLTTQIADGIGA